MIIVIGLVILVAALVIGLAGVLSNHGAGHALGHQFTILGQHIDGSSGRLFLYGVVLGAIGLAGLLMVLGGARRTSLRTKAAHRELKEARRETADIAHDRDQQVQAFEQAVAATAATSDTGAHSEAPADVRNHHFFNPTPPPPPPLPH